MTDGYVGTFLAKRVDGRVRITRADPWLTVTDEFMVVCDPLYLKLDGLPDGRTVMLIRDDFGQEFTYRCEYELKRNVWHCEWPD